MIGVERLAPRAEEAEPPVGRLEAKPPVRRLDAARAAGLAATLLLLQVPACASELVPEAGRFHHRRLGFTLDDPRATAPEWQRVRLEGAELAFRSPEGAAMSLILSCERAHAASPRLLARQLLIGLEAPELRESRAVTVDGAAGWLQVAEAHDAGRPVRLRSVTRPGPPCNLDFVLVGVAGPPAREADFERWWGSFRAGAGDASAAAEAP
jgi:hypothetical protein